LGCAIFGITEVPTDGVEFDTGSQAHGDTASPPIIPAPPANTGLQPTGAMYNPPPNGAAAQETASSSGWDPEKGEARKGFISTSSVQSPAVVIGNTNPTSQQPSSQQPQVDLLDSSNAAPQTDALGGSIHELD